MPHLWHVRLLSAAIASWGGVTLSKLEYGIFDIPVLTAGVSLPAEREFFVVPCIIPAKSSLNETYIDHM